MGTRLPSLESWLRHLLCEIRPVTSWSILEFLHLENRASNNTSTGASDSPLNTFVSTQKDITGGLVELEYRQWLYMN